MQLDAALHLGEVFYGNVGAADRLDFTILGPAVNEASRIESLCTALGHPILMSQSFADKAQNCRGQMVSVGEHVLRGVEEGRTLYALKPEGDQ